MIHATLPVPLRRKSFRDRLLTSNRFSLWQAGGVKSVTIAAGFVCSDGLVVACDLEITEATIKRVGGKSTSVAFGKDSAIAITGSGRYDLLAFACEQLTKDIQGATIDEVEDWLRRRMRELYKMYIRPCYDTAELDSVLQLLVGIVVAGEKRIYISNRNVLRRTGPYDFTGAGRDLAFYLAERSKPVDGIPSLQETGKRSRELIREVSKNVPGCGQDVTVIAIGQNGCISYLVDDS